MSELEKTILIVGAAYIFLWVIPVLIYVIWHNRRGGSDE